ncbi:MAG: FAD-dependent oxidoreductase [Chlamydiales bacterium]|jgi:glycine/D-amino acid oxidase-like deaminating enzyme/nitrite reductase/ring-hydroxylating ferredoxin subunit|nr:FAD-dependent oxidoreductase [Chlamydiales bacterium]
MPSHVSGNSLSIWQLHQETQEKSSLSPLSQNLTADVCIIGSGISGLTTAYLLLQEGFKVVILESKEILGGESARTTAHLSNAFDDHYHVIEKLHGLDGAKAVATSHTAAIDLIEKIVLQENISCGFERVNGYLFLAPGSSAGPLKEELEAATRAGLKGLEMMPLPVSRLQRSPALRFPNQAQIDPVQYLSRLTEIILAQGGKIFPHTHVTAIKGQSPCEVKTSLEWAVSADHVVVATNTPISDRAALHHKQSSYRTYVIAAAVKKDHLERALYWDMDDPYHYVRLQSGLDLKAFSLTEDQDLLIIGGEDHKTGHSSDGFERFARLEQWAKERFAIEAVIKRWSGQIQEPIDCLGYFGRDPSFLSHKNRYIVTGDSGNGMTHGTIAGLLIKDLILNQDNSWTKFYDPARSNFHWQPLKEWLTHNIESAANYACYLTSGDQASEDAIIPGTGAIIRQGLKKKAVYRDEGGQLHCSSAVCPHLGCIVNWNPFEKSWDCPCHGSRYDPYGQVINGPSSKNLKPL